mmetsp:Transcript_7941/g.28279  ORF Transcript_7941/g.28279 Transcript_7941/m.28279 type:complete len:827 (-) Transcript_7941:62-2542(-)
MASPDRAPRSWFKLGEFVAHAGAVNCVAVGPRSDQLLATGGDDCMVNVWRVGTSSALRALSGHAKPVTCVLFTNSEDFVVAGSQSGAIKLFDVKAARVAARLDGHMSECTSVDVHPYNSIVASGSYDTNIKLWDLKRSKEFITFKGHSKPVTCVRFSPDGRWVVSGSQDASVKIWDLTAGKMVHSFDTHRAPVSSVDFHPEEFILASGSHDRTVKLWDLESFSLQCTLPPDTQKVRKVRFVANGSAVLSATRDGVRVMSWDPTPRVRNVVDVPWKKVSAMHVMKGGKLLGCSAADALVSIWGVDIVSVNPTLHPDGEDAGLEHAERAAAKAAKQAAADAAAAAASPSEGGGASAPGGSGRKAARPTSASRPSVRDAHAAAAAVTPPRRPPTGPGRSGSSSAKRRGGAGGSDSPMSPADLAPPRRPGPHARWSDDTARRVAMGGTAGRSSGTDVDTLAAEMAAFGSEVFEAPEGAIVALPLPSSEVSSPRGSPRRQVSPKQKRHAPARSTLGEGGGDSAPPRRLEDNDILEQLAAAVKRHEPPSGGGSAGSGSGGDAGVGSGGRVLRPTSARRGRSGAGGSSPAAAKKKASPARSKDSGGSAAQRKAEKRAKVLVPAEREAPLGLRYEDFLPKATLSMSNGGKLRSYDAAGVMRAITHDRASFISVVQRRLSELTTCSAMWGGGNLRSALTHLSRLDNPAMTCDFLRSADLRSRAIKLESAAVLLPLVVNLLGSSLEDYSAVALRALQQLFSDFSTFVLDTRSAAAFAAGRGGGVNISMEEKLERCNTAHAEFERARPTVMALSRKPGSTGRIARALRADFDAYFSS